MADIFIKLLNMSITAGWIVLAVTAIRLIFKKTPKWISCSLWALVAVRLIFPFSFESVFSLIPSTEPVSPDVVIGGSHSEFVNSGLPAVNQVVNPVVSEITESGKINFTEILPFIWVAGIIAMLIYFAVSYIRVYRSVRASIRLKENIYICDDISAPFILGIVRPKIYLPSVIDERQMECVVAHEKAHIKRHDNLWKPLGFVLLSVYWFNPLMWLAYILLCRDIELACDERVIKKMETEDKKAYSEVLFEFSAPKRMVAVCPLAFGEVGVKTRIKSVLNYKKPTFWVVMITCIAIIVTSVCFLTNPVKKIDDELDAFISKTIIGCKRSRSLWGKSVVPTVFESHIVLGTDQFAGPEIAIYCLVLCREFSLDNSVVREVAGWGAPCVITAKKTNDGYVLVDFWEPDKSYEHPVFIRDIFPSEYYDDVLNITESYPEMGEDCRKQACEYFGVPYPSAGVVGADGTDEESAYSVAELASEYGLNEAEEVRNDYIYELYHYKGERTFQYTGRDEIVEYEFRLPQLKSTSSQAEEINSQIIDEYENRIKNEIKTFEYPDYWHMNIYWQSYLYDGLLSIIMVYDEYPINIKYYSVYLFDTDTERAVSNSELLARAGISEDEFISKAKEIAEESWSKVDFSNNDWGIYAEWTEKSHKDMHDHMISEDVISINTPMFIDDSGTLNAIILIFPDGWGDYTRRIVEIK